MYIRSNHFQISQGRINLNDIFYFQKPCYCFWILNKIPNLVWKHLLKHQAGTLCFDRLHPSGCKDVAMYHLPWPDDDASSQFLWKFNPIMVFKVVYGSKIWFENFKQTERFWLEKLWLHLHIQITCSSSCLPMNCFINLFMIIPFHLLLFIRTA